MLQVLSSRFSSVIRFKQLRKILFTLGKFPYVIGFLFSKRLYLIVPLQHQRNKQDMKKVIVLGVATIFLLSSCDSNMGSIYAGGSLGSVLGSAIGGIAGGARGSDIGTIIGMAGGAAAGAAIDAKTKKKSREYAYGNERLASENRKDVQEPYYQQQIDTEQYNNLPQTTDENGSDSTNAEDNGQYGFQIESPNGFTETNAKPVYFSNKSSIERLTPSTNEMPNIEISKVVFADNDGNNILKRGEIGKIAFEIHNNGTQAISDLYPTITEATYSGHFRISPTTRINLLKPSEVVRYTATIMADNRIKTGEYNFLITILKDNKSITKVMNLRLSTQK